MRIINIYFGYIVKNIWLRLLIAGFISLTSLAIVQIWFDLTKPELSGQSNQEPIAFIKQIKDDVDRRPVKRQVWQSLTKGDYVFSGEAIRTLKDSEVQIEFIEGGRSINIEPESIVLIAQNSNKELALDLMEGGASVVANESKKDDSTINLIQNGKSIVIKGSAVLSKSNTGSLEIQSNDIVQNINPFFINMNDTRLMSFKLMAPLKDKIIFTDGQFASVKLMWQSQAKDLQVKVSLGSQRSFLNTVRNVLPGDPQAADFNLNAGFHFFKMYFINQKTQKIVAESKLQRIKIVERNMPVVVNPTLNQTFLLTESQQNIQFNWTPGEYVKSYHLEVFKDVQLKNRILNKSFEKSMNFETQLPEGEYHYRLSAKFETENKLILGKVEKFNIVKKLSIENTAQTILPPPEKIEQISWVQTNYLDDLGAEEQKYIGSPEVEMKWETLKAERVSEYKIKLTPVDQPETKPFEIKSSTSVLKAKVLKPGRYIASIEGVDKSQKIVAASNPKAFVISELELLKAPLFEGGNKLVANKKGDFKVKWQSLDGAYRYKINLFDRNGKVLATQTTQNPVTTEVSFEDMSPGDYRIEVAGVDRGNRLGVFAKKIINVLDTTDLSAPRIKKLKVK